MVVLLQDAILKAHFPVAKMRIYAHSFAFSGTTCVGCFQQAHLLGL